MQVMKNKKILKVLFCVFYLVFASTSLFGKREARDIVTRIKEAYRENLWFLKKRYLDPIFIKSWHRRLSEFVGFSSDTDLDRSKLRLGCLKQMGSIKDLGDIDRLSYEKIKNDIISIFRSYRRFISLDKYKDQILQLDILLNRRGVYVGRVFESFGSIENQPFIRDVLNTLKADVGLSV